jgi:zinc protease
MNKTLRFVGWLLILSLASVPSFSQVRRGTRTQPRSPSRTAPAYLQQLKSLEETTYLTKGVLKNGLTVLVQEFRAYPLVDVTTCIRGGYRGETPDSEGLARILREIYFSATTTHNSGVVAGEIRAMGGTPASTAAYGCVFHDLTAPAAQWKKALEIQADALLNLALDPGDLKSGFGSVATADRLASDDSDAVVLMKLMELAFDRHNYAFTDPSQTDVAIGTSRERLQSLYRAAYDPSRVILVISGAVNSAEVLNEVVRLYNRPVTAAKPAPTPAATAAAQRGFRYGAVNRSGSDARVLIGFHVAPATSPDFPALEVLNALLGSGESSVLADRVRDEKKVSLNGFSRLEADKDDGYLRLELQTDPSNLDRCEIAVMTEIEILKSADPDEEDVARAEAQLERQFWERQQTVTQKAHELARFELLGDWKSVNQFVPGIRKVKPSDVFRVAKRYLDLDNCTVVESLPPGTGNRSMNAATMLGTLQALLPASAEQGAAERERETRPAITLPEGPDGFKYSEIQYPMRKASVLRGPELFIQEDHTLPLIHVGFFYPGGRLLENQDNSGISALLLRTLLLASRDGEAGRLRRQLGINGAQVTPFVGDDYFGFLLTGISSRVESDLDVLDKFLQFPKLDKDELDRFKQMQLGQAEHGDATPLGRALDRLDHALFGAHPYGRPADGTPAGISSVSADLLRAWYDTSIHNRKPVVLIVGDTQGTSLAGFFVRRFSGARFQDVKMPEAFAGAGDRKKSNIEEKPSGSASAALIGFLAPPAGDEDSYAMMVLQAHLSGPVGLLSENLRSKPGAAGCASSVYVPRANGGTAVLFAFAEPGMEGKLADALDADVRGLLGQPMPYKDYRSAVNSAVGRYWIGQQDRTDRILSLATAIVSGQPFDEILDYAVRLQQVGEEDLEDVARRILNLDKSVVLRMPAGARQ